MKTPSQIIDDLIDIEGDFVDHPDDLGRATRWGITEAVARANGYNGPMALLPKMTAKLIYMSEYWVKPGFDQVNKLSNSVAIELFDTGVNMGKWFAGKSFQRLLNAFTGSGLIVDGKVGNLTLMAFKMYLDRRAHQDGHDVMVKGIKGLRVARYLDITEKRPQNQKFIYGWLRYRV